MDQMRGVRAAARAVVSPSAMDRPSPSAGSAPTVSAAERDLAKRYGPVDVFRNVTLSVAAGEFVAIVGESGVGKSTLLNGIAGLDTLDAGSVQLAGREVTTMNDDELALLRRRDIGFVFQAFHVLPHLTVAQNVALPLLLLQRPDVAQAEQPDTPFPDSRTS